MINPTAIPATRWNLEPIETFLKNAASKEWQSKITAALADAEQAFKTGSIEGRFKRLIQLESKIGCVISALNLVGLQQEDTSQYSAVELWLSEATGVLVQRIDAFYQSLSNRECPLPEPLYDWYRSIHIEKQFNDRLGAYRALRRESREGTLSSADALLKRAQIDPDAIALEYRLNQNQLQTEAITFSGATTQESNAYFSKLVASMGVASAPLSDIRIMEQERYRVPGLGWTTAWQTLSAAFESVHPVCKTYLNDARLNGHVRLIREPNQPDMCIDSPFGSFVQLNYHESLNGLCRLAHEMGHAIHQSLHRESGLGFLALTDVESETWAMAFEHQLLKYLREPHPEWATQIEAFKEAQWIEMNHRHRMLTCFEQALHNSNLQTEEDINELWLQINTSFYGPFVTFDANFRSAWKEVTHFWNAPFYMAVYPIAKTRSAQCDLSAMIQSIQLKKELI